MKTRTIGRGLSKSTQSNKNFARTSVDQENEERKFGDPLHSFPRQGTGAAVFALANPVSKSTQRDHVPSQRSPRHRNPAKALVYCWKLSISKTKIRYFSTCRQKFPFLPFKMQAAKAPNCKKKYSWRVEVNQCLYKHQGFELPSSFWYLQIANCQEIYQYGQGLHLHIRLLRIWDIQYGTHLMFILKKKHRLSTTLASESEQLGGIIQNLWILMRGKTVGLLNTFHVSLKNVCTWLNLHMALCMRSQPD